MQVRHEGATNRPSVWRVLPLLAGVALLVATLVVVEPTEKSVISPGTMSLMMLGGAFLTGLGLLIAMPLAVRGVADLITESCGGVTARLAARRLQVEPASTVRLVAGLTIAVFLITGAIGVLATFQSSNQYLIARHAYEQADRRGPGRHHELRHRLRRMRAVGWRPRGWRLLREHLRRHLRAARAGPDRAGLSRRHGLADQRILVSAAHPW